MSTEGISNIQRCQWSCIWVVCTYATEIYSYPNEWMCDNEKSQSLCSPIGLLLDNAPSHGLIREWSNVRVIFLPPNCTSVFQPIDQGSATYGPRAFSIRSASGLSNLKKRCVVGLCQSRSLIACLRINAKSAVFVCDHAMQETIRQQKPSYDLVWRLVSCTRTSSPCPAMHLCTHTGPLG